MLANGHLLLGRIMWDEHATVKSCRFFPSSKPKKNQGLLGQKFNLVAYLNEITIK